MLVGMACDHRVWKSSLLSWSSAEYGGIGQRSARCVVKTTATRRRNVEALVIGLDSSYCQRTAATTTTLCLQELADLLADGNSKSKVVLREDTKRGEWLNGAQQSSVPGPKNIPTHSSSFFVIFLLRSAVLPCLVWCATTA